LRALLSGTQRTYRFLDDKTVTIVPVVASTETVSFNSSSGTSAEARHTTSSGDQAATAESGRPVTTLDGVTVFGRGVVDTTREIPQTVRAIGREEFEAAGAVRLQDVIQFIPTASSLLSQFTPLMNLTIRGFAASTTWNGLPMGSMSSLAMRDLANVERVEVLSGPASVLYGSMQPGAVVNIVTKTPADVFHTDLGLEYGSHERQFASFEVGGPLTERVRAMLSVSYEDTGAPMDHWRMKGMMVAPVVEFDLGTDTRLILDGVFRRTEYPEGYYDGRRPIRGTLLPNPLGEISFSWNPAYEPGITELTYDQSNVVARLEHDFTPTQSLNVALAYNRSVHDEWSIFSNGVGADNRTVSRSLFIADGRTTENFTAHVDTRGEFDTGPLSHKYVVGVDYRDQPIADRSASFGITSIDAFNPVYGTVALPNPIPFETRDESLETIEGFLQDRISVAQKFHVILGARYSDISSSSVTRRLDGVVLSSTGSQTEAWSTQAGLVYDLTDDVSLFASRNTSFTPRTYQLESGVAVVDPERGTQLELGAKADLGASGLSGNLAAFQIEKPNVLTISPANPTYRVPLGAVRSQGVELSVQGNPIPGWSLYAAYGYMETEVTQSNDAVLRGKEFQNAPKNSFTLLTGYEMQTGALSGLQMSAVVRHLGTRWVDSTNSVELPSYTQVDLSVSYPLNDRFKLSVFGKNLTDEDAWTGFVNYMVVPSLGRNYLVRLNYSL
ncbi:TonB-dependent siderophore receptor, partial [Steroidobacter sp.]|uniref:TonB-dependent siderophore receptor n=1 Tax=Steroidobacter sp. TaxID=1978227 RepID=UPI001A45044D